MNAKPCPRCGREFSRKDNLIRHLKKKKECETKYINIDRQSIIQDYNKYHNVYLSSQNKSQNMKKINDMGYECEHCNKTFTKKNNYYRHKKNYCKVIKTNDNMKRVKEDYNELMYKRELEKMREMYEAKIKKLEKIIRDHPRIKINDYEKEKYPLLATEQWCELFDTEYDIVINYIRMTYIDVETNRNIYVPDPSNKYVKVFQNGRWELIDRKKLINKIITNITDRIENIVNKHKKDFKDLNLDMVHYALQRSKSDDEFKTKALLLLHNNSDIVKKTYEFNYHDKLSKR